MLTIGKVPLFGSELLGLHDANSARISMQRLGKSFTSTEKPHWQRHHWSTRPNWLWASLSNADDFGTFSAEVAEVAEGRGSQPLAYQYSLL